MNAAKTIPVTIITGFLGAGKTTLLNRILHAEHGLRIAVLVNDFGAINIDSQIVVGLEGETISLSNGCICCSIRGDLLKAVVELLQRPEVPDYILVETSGVSDPLEVASTFQAIQGLEIDSVLTLIDAEQILSIDRRYAVLAMNQIGTADIVILNKVDLVSQEQLEAVQVYIRGIRPKARILETVEGNVPLELLLNLASFNLERFGQRQIEDIHVHADEDRHEHPPKHEDHSLVFNTWSWQSEEAVSAKALMKMVEDLPESIYRAKGIFYLADEAEHKAVLQVVGQRASLRLSETWGAEKRQSSLVVIGAGGELNNADLEQRLQACLAINAANSQWERLSTGILNWLRERISQ